MPNSSGVSVRGRQVLGTLTGTERGCIVSIREPGGGNELLWKRYGQVALERAVANDGNRLYQWVTTGCWVGGAILIAPIGATAGAVTTQVVGYWFQDDCPWRVTAFT